MAGTEKLWVSSLALEDKYKLELTKAIRIFHAQLAGDSWERTDNFYEATYIIGPYIEYKFYPCKERSMDRKFYVLFQSWSEFAEAMNVTKPSNSYNWVRKYTKENPAYEVTSRGDRRYSPFFQVAKDPLSGNWISAQDYFKKYIQPLPSDKKVGTAHKFWAEMFKQFRGLMYELAVIGGKMPLADMFDVNGGQNSTYCDILNVYYDFYPDRWDLNISKEL